MATFMYPVPAGIGPTPETAETTQRDPEGTPSVERQAATSRDTGGSAAQDKPSINSGGRRRRGTVAGDMFSNNTNSIL
jgi:hypothetical protein